MALVLGVDAGSSKTICVAMDPGQRKVVAKAVTGPCNW